MSKITYVSSDSLLGSFICLSEMEFKEFDPRFKYVWSNLKFLNFEVPSVLVKKDNFESTKISNFSLKLGVKAWLEGKICPTLNIIHKSVL